MPTSPCPDRDQLLDYLLGKLPDDASEQIAAHLDECPPCEAAAETLDRVSDTLVSQLERPVVPSRFAHEPQYQQALQRVLAQADGESDTMGDRVATVAVDSPVPESLGEYELLEKLGEGGMGAVYKARQRNLDRLVALKVLPKHRTDNAVAIGRFYREMQAVGRLNHPNIVAAHDAREIDGAPVLAMEYIDGWDLAKLVSDAGPLTLADACELVRQTAVGLQHAHEQGLVHRDIKPSNVMLNRQGVVKILDLGLARLNEDQPNRPEMTAAGTAMGTADYFSPEQVNDSHSVDVRSDIYSLGCTLYKLLSGQTPFAGPEYKNDVTKMMAHVHGTPRSIGELRPDLPPGLVVIIQKMMAKDPSGRFAEPGEVAIELEALAAGADLRGLLNAATGHATPSPLDISRKASTGKLSASAEVDTGVGQSPIVPDSVVLERRVGTEAAPVRESAGKPQVVGKPPIGTGPGFGARRPLIGIAVALGLIGIIWLGVVLLRVKTPAGTIILEVDQLELAGAVVEVDGQQRVTIDPGKGLEKVIVTADEKDHVLRVVKGGFETFTRKFTLKAGEEQTITVRLEPLGAPATHVAESLRDSNSLSERPGHVDGAPREDKAEPKPTPPIPPPAKTETASRSSPPYAEREGHIATDTTWTPGPLYNALAGCIPRPAKLPGIKRWQIMPTAPRSPITSIDWSSTGLIAIAAQHIWIYDAETLEVQAIIRGEQAGYVFQLAWNPDGSQLATIGDVDGVLRLWTPDGSLERSLKGQCNARAKLCWSPDGQRIACGDGADPKQVRIVNLDGTPGSVFKGHEDSVTAVGWSPDGKHLVSSSQDKTVRVWNLDGTPGLVLTGHKGPVHEAAWSPDGQWIASAGYDTARLWKSDGSAGPTVEQFHVNLAYHVAWHPDSRRFVINWHYCTVVNDTDGKVVLPISDAPGGTLAAWSPDGKQLVGCDA
jgi:serine/threonine protein kinase/WD40 repeat protein